LDYVIQKLFTPELEESQTDHFNRVKVIFLRSRVSMNINLDDYLYISVLNNITQLPTSK
jgi:hypothetical protein